MFCLKQGDLERALLGLRLSYGHVNVEFDVNKVENMVIQAISSLDALDEDIAYSSMRVRSVDISTGFSFSFPFLIGCCFYILKS